jgi:hypothetical protein
MQPFLLLSLGRRLILYYCLLQSERQTVGQEPDYQIGYKARVTSHRLNVFERRF